MPELSASTNSATWAFQEKREFYNIKMKTNKTLMKTIEDTVQGHRDGHGFVLRDDGGEEYSLLSGHSFSIFITKYWDKLFAHCCFFSVSFGELFFLSYLCAIKMNEYNFGK